MQIAFFSDDVHSKLEGERGATLDTKNMQSSQSKGHQWNVMLNLYNNYKVLILSLLKQKKKRFLKNTVLIFSKINLA